MSYSPTSTDQWAENDLLLVLMHLQCLIKVVYCFNFTTLKSHLNQHKLDIVIYNDITSFLKLLNNDIKQHVYNMYI